MRQRPLETADPTPPAWRSTLGVLSGLECEQTRSPPSYAQQVLLKVLNVFSSRMPLPSSADEPAKITSPGCSRYTIGGSVFDTMRRCWPLSQHSVSNTAGAPSVSAGGTVTVEK